jgi:L-fucose isomerase-like protein
MEAGWLLWQIIHHGCLLPVWVNFTVLEPHVVHPCSPRFLENIDYFDRVCRTVNGVKGSIIGAIGARTTPFKTVRIDEVALQRHHITVETLDLSDIFGRMRSLNLENQMLSNQKRMCSSITHRGQACQRKLLRILFDWVLCSIR